MNDAINRHDIDIINYVLGKGGVDKADDLAVALNEHLINSGHLVVEHGRVYASAKGCVAVRDFHECTFKTTSRREVFDSHGRYRGQIAERACECGETKTVNEIIRDGRQRNPYAVL